MGSRKLRVAMLALLSGIVAFGALAKAQPCVRVNKLKAPARVSRIAKIAITYGLREYPTCISKNKADDTVSIGGSIIHERQLWRVELEATKGKAEPAQHLRLRWESDEWESAVQSARDEIAEQVRPFFRPPDNSAEAQIAEPVIIKESPAQASDAAQTQEQTEKKSVIVIEMPERQPEKKPSATMHSEGRMQIGVGMTARTLKFNRALHPAIERQNMDWLPTIELGLAWSPPWRAPSKPFFYIQGSMSLSANQLDGKGETYSERFGFATAGIRWRFPVGIHEVGLRLAYFLRHTYVDYAPSINARAFVDAEYQAFAFGVDGTFRIVGPLYVGFQGAWLATTHAGALTQSTSLSNPNVGAIHAGGSLGAHLSSAWHLELFGDIEHYAFGSAQTRWLPFSSRDATDQYRIFGLRIRLSG